VIVLTSPPFTIASIAARTFFEIRLAGASGVWLAARSRDRAAVRESAYTGAMEIKNPLAVTLTIAVAVNCVGVGYGVQLFTDLPPTSAIAASASSGLSSVSHWVRFPFYSTTTDELIEAPAPEQNKASQS
jgi:hypothetical protein